MIYLELFLSFLEIGAVSFGGGYGMIAMIRDTVITKGWLTEEQLLNFIAVSESTPGPIAINMATFIGSSQAGILGALCATLGVVLPSFCIILLICALLRNLLKFAGVKAVLSGIRPAVIGLILATAVTFLLGTLFSFSVRTDTFSPDFKSIALFAGIVLFAFLYRRVRKKNVSPILCILLSGVAGVFLFS